MTTVERALYDYVDHLNALAAREPVGVRKYSVLNGKTYYKVVVDSNHQRFVHSFVSKDHGYLYKAAGWARPVKSPKFNLVTQLDVVKQVADLFGAYLYADFRLYNHPNFNTTTA